MIVTEIKGLVKMFIRPKYTTRVSFSEFAQHYHQLIDELSKGAVFTVFTTHHEIAVHKNTRIYGAYFISDQNDICGYTETHNPDELLNKVKRALNLTSEVEKPQALSDELNVAAIQEYLEKLDINPGADVHSNHETPVKLGEAYVFEGDNFYEESAAKTHALNANKSKLHQSEGNPMQQIAHTYIPMKQPQLDSKAAQFQLVQHHLTQLSLYPPFKPNPAMINALNRLKGVLTVEHLTGWRDLHKMQISDFTDKHADALIQLVQEEKIAPNDAIAKISKLDHEQLTKLNLVQRGYV